jgi:hypothetical protein
LALELSILWLDFDVLNDHDFILKSHSIERQRVGVDCVVFPIILAETEQ